MSTTLDKYLPFADVPTPKPEKGLWMLMSPSGKTYVGDSPIDCIRLEIDSRVPPQVALGRIARAMNEEDGATGTTP